MGSAALNAIAQRRLIETPAAGLYPIALGDANRLLVAWKHKLGACERPFHSEAFAFEVHGEPIAVAISASIVNGPVGGFGRMEVVELARQGASRSWANRVMLRLWREVCAPSWPCWKVKAVVSYSHNGMHSGQLYRFDGWRKVRDDAGSSGGGTWSTKRDADDVKRGSKSLWLYEYGAAA